MLKFHFRYACKQASYSIAHALHPLKNYLAFGDFITLLDVSSPQLCVRIRTMLCECMSFNTISFSALRESFVIISSPLVLPLQSLSPSSSLSLRTEYKVYLTVNLEIMHSSCEWVSKVERKRDSLQSRLQTPNWTKRGPAKKTRGFFLNLIVVDPLLLRKKQRNERKSSLVWSGLSDCSFGLLATSKSKTQSNPIQ